MVVFTASDGTTFEDRNAWRKYEFETNYTFRNAQKQTLVKAPGKISGQPFDLSDLSDCEVLLLDQCDQVQVDNLTNCRVFIGPCSESVFVRNCTNCVFTVACKQLRTRDSAQCSFYLYSLTDPIIETSQQMKFAPFNGAYNGIERHFVEARLEPTNNHWSQVYDFNDPDKSSGNWKLMTPEEEAAPWVVNLDGLVSDPSALGACVNPVARDSGFIKYTESSSSSMASFTFKTSQKEAEKVVENQTEAPSSQQAAASGTLAPAAVGSPPAPVLFASPASGAVPPPPVAMFSGIATVVHLPPPAPSVTASATAAPPSMAENQKVAVIEAAEHLAPPLPQAVESQRVLSSKALPPLEHIASPAASMKDSSEPAQDTADMLEQLLNLGPAGSSTPSS